MTKSKSLLLVPLLALLAGSLMQGCGNGGGSASPGSGGQGGSISAGSGGGSVGSGGSGGSVGVGGSVVGNGGVSGGGHGGTPAATSHKVTIVGSGT